MQAGKRVLRSGERSGNREMRNEHNFSFLSISGVFAIEIPSELQLKCYENSINAKMCVTEINQL